MRTHY